MDKFLGRKARFNWGKNSKREWRLIEKIQFKSETYEELAQDKDQLENDIADAEYQSWLDNYWAWKLIK